MANPRFKTFCGGGGGYYRCCEPRPDCSIFTDRFNEDNLATDYTIVSGTWSVSASALHVSSASALIVANTAIPAGNTAAFYSVQVTCATTNDEAWLIFAYTDSSNYWYLSAKPGAGAGELKFFEVSGGTATQQGPTHTIAGFSAGGTVTMYISYGNGTAQVGVELQGDPTCYPVPVSIGNTQAGLGTGPSASSITFDTFKVSYLGTDIVGCPTGDECDLCGMCEEIRGDFPNGWPNSITLTISGACCAKFNQSVTFNKLGSAIPVYELAGTVRDCENGFQGGASWTLFCSNGNWFLDGATQCDCDGTGEFLIPVTILSCDPFHATATLPICFDTFWINSCCNGALQLDFTE